MANLVELQKRVLLVAKDAPVFIVDDALFDTVQDLCINAEVWQVMADIDIASGDNEITISTPGGTIPVRTMWVSLGGRRLEAVSPDKYMALTASPLDSIPRFYYQESQSLLLTYPTPLVSEEGKARVVLALKTGSTAIPDDIMNLYRETIINGAISRVLAAPTDFGDAKLSSYYEQKWQIGLGAAKGRANRRKDNQAIVAVYGGY
jgi:hypothetical protein